jgi:hypothetical protein
MAVCPKCHRFKTKAYLSRHKRYCVPTQEQLEHYVASKSSGEKKKKKKNDNG